MIRITSEKEFLEAFRLLDRPEIQLPEGLQFPLVIRDYRAWTEPSGHRVFVIYADPHRRVPFGIVLRKDQSGAGAAAKMCDWCHAVRSGDGVTMMTAAASEKRRVGVHVCRDLSCRDRIEEAPGVDDLPQAMSERERLRRVVARMSEFSRKNLF